MTSLMKEFGFNRSEIKSFKEYWNVKLPNDDLCIFPQASNELNLQAQIELKPLPKKLVRVVFMTVLKSAIEQKSESHFSALPEKSYRVPKPTEFAKEATADYEVYEWGVGFHFTNDKKTAKTSSF